MPCRWLSSQWEQYKIDQGQCLLRILHRHAEAGMPEHVHQLRHRPSRPNRPNLGRILQHPPATPRSGNRQQGSRQGVQGPDHRRSSMSRAARRHHQALPPRRCLISVRSRRCRTLCRSWDGMESHARRPPTRADPALRGKESHAGKAPHGAFNLDTHLGIRHDPRVHDSRKALRIF